MAQKNTPHTNAMPRLLVKIVGSKQIKQFEEVQRETKHETSKKEEADPPFEGEDDDLEKPTKKQNAMEARSHGQMQNRVGSELWAVINQVPARLCVTAPSGDRSRSYIHPKPLKVTEARAAEVDTTQQKGVSEDRDKAELSAAVRDELSHWQLSSLRSTEDEVAALDPSFSGTLNRSEITRLFLKNDVPLKLPTFSLLLQMFADKNDPILIDYRNLLQFIRDSAFTSPVTVK